MYKDIEINKLKEKLDNDIIYYCIYNAKCMIFNSFSEYDFAMLIKKRILSYDFCELVLLYNSYYDECLTIRDFIKILIDYSDNLLRFLCQKYMTGNVDFIVKDYLTNVVLSSIKELKEKC